MQPNVRPRINRPVVSIILVALAILAGTYWFLAVRPFHIVSTNPKTNNVASVSPFLEINFNHTLSPKGLSVSSQPSIIDTYVVKGKVLDLILKSPLATSTTYTISLTDISDSNGNKLSKALSFKPKDLSYNQLSKQQQQALLQQQTTHPQSKNNNSFLGFDDFLTYGITTTQLNSLEQIIFNFSPSAKVVTLDTGSVSPVPHNAESTSTSDSINFSLKIGSKDYNAKIDYSSLTVIRLYLYDPSDGSLVYDSQ